MTASCWNLAGMRIAPDCPQVPLRHERMPACLTVSVFLIAVDLLHVCLLSLSSLLPIHGSAFIQLIIHAVTMLDV